VKLALRIFSVSQSTFLRVLQKITACTQRSSLSAGKAMQAVRRGACHGREGVSS
jgi:hypothetical protein